MTILKSILFYLVIFSITSINYAESMLSSSSKIQTQNEIKKDIQKEILKVTYLERIKVAIIFTSLSLLLTFLLISKVTKIEQNDKIIYEYQKKN